MGSRRTKRNDASKTETKTLTPLRSPVHSRSSLLGLDIPLQPNPIRVVLVVLLPLQHLLGNEGSSNDVVPGLGHGDVDLVGDRVDPGSLELSLDSVSEKSIASGVSNVHDSLFRVARGLNHLNVRVGGDLGDESEVLGGEIGESGDVDFVDDEEGGLVSEEGFDGVEELALEEGREEEEEEDANEVSL